ncbi:Spy/CpxP family protein refolding chaperone [Mongoliitalea daihaiensis]|nr:Spy/CpxP family protein refolding chaperone [Mongoliitalea daihaiensis]
MFALSLQSLAQQQGNRNYDKEKLESARIAFITNRLDLKPEQAEKFWPMFNQYNEKRTAVMESMVQLNKASSDDMSDNQAREIIKNRLANQQKMLDLETEFMESIITVISPKQAVNLSSVNREFTRQIYRSQQRGGGGRNN